MSRRSTEADWIAAGLLDPAADEAEDRRELLAYLASLGITVEEMVAAEEQRGLGAAATDQLLHQQGSLTLADIAAAAGLGTETARRVMLAAGFALPAEDEAGLDEEDAHIVEAFNSAMQIFGEEAVLAFTRVVGASLARIAEAADAMFLSVVEAPMRAGGSSQAEVARTARQGVELLLGLPAVMAPMFRRHVNAAVQRSRAARTEGRIDRFLLAVGFSDLVGSTQLARQVSPAELGAAMADFEREAADRATGRGARLVKSIGDEVMVVAADPVAVVDVLAGLAGFVHRHPVLTEVRAAVAYGDLVAQGGDYFGADVNLAARAVKEAEPGQVVVTTAVADVLAAAGRATSPLGPRALRGVGEGIDLHTVAAEPGGGPAGPDG